MRSPSPSVTKGMWCSISSVVSTGCGASGWIVCREVMRESL